jgi:hypothetical protein
MACSADAFKLINRCKKKGFSKISQGLTKPERQMSRLVSRKVQQLNQNSKNPTDITFSKRHIHTIVKIRKDNPKIPIDTYVTDFTLENSGSGVNFKISNMRRKPSRRDKSRNHHLPAFRRT